VRRAAAGPTPLFPALSSEDAAALSAEWTDVPHPTWHGPTDDNALVTIALHSRSKLATLFPKIAKATFKQLWEADTDKLAKHFPPTKEGDATTKVRPTKHWRVTWRSDGQQLDAHGGAAGALRTHALEA